MSDDHGPHAPPPHPPEADAHFRAGVAALQQGQLLAARDAFLRGLSLAPHAPLATFNLGVIHHDLGELETALFYYNETIRFDPASIVTFNNIALIYKALGEPQKAIEHYLKILKIDPLHLHTTLMLCELYMNQKQFIHVKNICHNFLSFNPKCNEIRQYYAKILSYLSDYKHVLSESNLAIEGVSTYSIIWEQRLYCLSYHPDLKDIDIYNEFSKWGSNFKPSMSNFVNHNRESNRRLRVGYVSPDFRAHSSRLYFWPLFANHDPAAVELFAYSNVKTEVAWTRLFRGQFDHWRDIRSLSDEAAAALIREDRIDVLVDLCGHMQDERLGVFALKPAPVQVTWLGSAWTTGLPAIDYVLFDPYVAPEGTLTSEAIHRLPHSFMVFRPSELAGDVHMPPCRRRGFVTFGYTGRTERLNHRVFKAWAAILKELPNAQLLLDYGPFADPDTRAYYRDTLARAGLDVGRITFRNSTNIFQGLNDIDILLDSFPHSGGTMLMDAFWMGVPAVTLASRPPVGRLGLGMLMNLGLPDWVAHSEAEYVAKACCFARQPELLEELRLGMRDRMRRSPLLDGPGFARSVEAAYRTMFARWCALPPTPGP